MATMPGDNTAALMQFVMQLQNLRRQKAADFFSTINPRPGETFASIPGAEKQFKRLTGMKADPNREVVPHTAASMLSEDDMKTLRGLSPEIRQGMAANRLINATTGQTGITTPEAYASGQQATTDAASARATVTAAGRKAIESLPAAELAKAGEKGILGETGKTTVAGEKTAVAQSGTAENQEKITGSGVTVAEGEAEEAKTKMAMTKYAQGFLADPRNSAWGRLLQGAGLDPQAVTEAFASGQGAVLGGLLDMKAALTKSGSELQDYLQKARIDSAKDLSSKLGGKLGIQTILALENAVETGKDPYQVGAAPGDVAVWLKAREVGTAGYLRDQVARNNPQAKLFEQMTTNMKNFPEGEQFNAANTMAAWTAAQVLTEGDFGPMPNKQTNPTGYKTWNDRAKYHFNSLGLTGKPMDTFMGIDILNPDNTGVTQFPAFDPNNPNAPKVKTDTTGKGAATGPGFSNDSTAAAVQNALNFGGFRQPVTPTPGP